MFYPPNHRRPESRAGEIPRDFGWSKTWFRFAREASGEAAQSLVLRGKRPASRLSLAFDARLSGHGDVSYACGGTSTGGRTIESETILLNI